MLLMAPTSHRSQPMLLQHLKLKMEIILFKKTACSLTLLNLTLEKLFPMVSLVLLPPP